MSESVSISSENKASNKAGSNAYVGTWRMISAQLDPQGKNVAVFGPEPNGWLIFTADMTYVEVLTDSRIPRFASGEIGQGTDAENRAAMAGGIGAFGRYSLDENGVFNGDTVEGSTFPNWVGDVRTSKDLKITVDGDRMTNRFAQPDGTVLEIHWERVQKY